ncbi:hypothetical protein [Corallococcus exiguus]|uniref:hypothetical protein n=1 Tax=Corallococcus exiguus TaxID=83462 RepID=UPI001471EE7F|nr:hypothetical protein [Corallococcus exiguus]NNB89225.1 hypothetical protein [Corallococcus exiguus]
MRRLSVPRWMSSWLGGGLAVALGLTGCGPAESPEDFRLAEAEAAVTFEPASGVLFGAFAGKRGTEDHAAALDALERLAERKMDVHRIYAVWDEAQPNKFLLADLARGTASAGRHPSRGGPGPGRACARGGGRAC